MTTAQILQSAMKKYANNGLSAPKLTTSNAAGSVSAFAPKAPALSSPTQSLAKPMTMTTGGSAPTGLTPPKPLAPPPPPPPVNPTTPVLSTPNQPLSLAQPAPAPAAPAPAAPQMTGPTQPQPIVSNTQGTMTDTQGKPVQTSGPAPEVKPVAFAEIEGKLNDSNIPVEQRKQFAEKFVTDHLTQNPELVQGFRDAQAGKNTPQAQAYQAKFKSAQDAYIQQQVQADPQKAATPQGFGEIVNNAMSTFQNMPPAMQAMVGIGIPMGLIGVMSSLFGGGGMGMGIMGMLGLGAGVVGGAAGGMFGQGAQNMAADAAYQMGSFFGAVPEGRKGSLDALRGEDAIARLTSGPSLADTTSALWDPKAFSKTVQQKMQQAEQVKKLMAMPEGMRPQFLRNIDPSLSPEDAVIVARNAAQIAAQMEDPNSAVAKMLQDGKEFVANPEKVRNQKAWDAVTGWVPGTDAWANQAQATPMKETRSSANMNLNKYIEKWAFNDMDAKELSDLESWQMTTKKYDADKVRRLYELQKRQVANKPKEHVIDLTMKCARCWAGYEPVPGKKPYSNDSCRPVGSKKKTPKKQKSAE